MNKSNSSSLKVFSEEHCDSKRRRKKSKLKTNINELIQRKNNKKVLIKEEDIDLSKINSRTSPNSDDENQFQEKNNKSFCINHLKKTRKRNKKYNNRNIRNVKKEIKKTYINEVEVIELSDSDSNEDSIQKVKKMNKSFDNEKRNFFSNFNNTKMENKEKDNYKEPKIIFHRKSRIPIIKEKSNNISIKIERISEEDFPITIALKSNRNKVNHNNGKTHGNIKKEKDISFDKKNSIIIMDYHNEEIRKSYIELYSFKNNNKNRGKGRKKNNRKNLIKTFEKDNQKNNYKIKFNKKNIFKVIHDERQFKNEISKKIVKLPFNCSNYRNSGYNKKNNKRNSLLNLKENMTNINNINSGFPKFNSHINKKKFNEELLTKYKFNIYEINESLFTIILKKIPNYNPNIFNVDKFKDNIEILIKKEDSNIADNSILLGHKRKRNKKKIKNGNRRKELKIKEKEEKEMKIIKLRKDKTKEKKIKNEKKNNSKKTNLLQINNRRKENIENLKGKTIDNIPIISSINITEFNTSNVKNKKGNKNCSSGNINLKKQKEKFNKNEEYNGFNSITIKSLSEQKKEKKICFFKNNKKQSINNNINNKYNVEKIENNVILIKKNKIDNSISNFPINTNNSYDINVNVKTIDSGSYVNLLSNESNGSCALETFSFSLPINEDDKIQFFQDPSYFSKDSKYIKYSPIDKYLPSIPYDKKKFLPPKHRKTQKINFCKKDHILIDNDNKIQELTYFNSDDENDDLFPILSIPRIKPSRDEYTLKIKNRLVKEEIKNYQIEDENIKKEEQYFYISSFVLYDEENNIKIYVPCYKSSSKIEEFVIKKNLEIIEFQEDNDIDTDEEQLQLEVDRNNEAFINFMKKVENEKDYVENNLNRKKKC